MKPNFRNIAFILMAITAKRTSAQSSFDMAGTIPQSRILKRGNSFGFDLGFFGEPLNFSGKKKGPDFIAGSGSGISLRPQLRLGGNYFYSELGQKKIFDVPLAPPATGASAATVDGRFWGCNFAARVSLPYSAKIVPYADVFAGITNFATSITVRPYDVRKTTTTQPLYDFLSLSYGGALGVMVPMGKYWKLDLGVVYSDFLNQGKMINADSARLEGSSVAVDRMDTPQSMVMFKAGLTYCFNSSSWSGHGYYGSGYRSGSYHSGHSHWGGHCGGGSHVSVHVH